MVGIGVPSQPSDRTVYYQNIYESGQRLAHKPAHYSEGHEALLPFHHSPDDVFESNEPLAHTPMDERWVAMVGC